ncbi:MAG: hypothetical protein ACXVZR_03825 [Terriglobales bacterium]
MTKKDAIGHMNCPTCQHPQAEVKEDKNGHAFLFCEQCATQVFTRKPHRDRLMRKNMRPVTVTEPNPAPEPEQKPEPTPAPAPTPAPKKSGWLTPIMS